ncbi:hypothetical protein A9Q90_04850 [Gammaproteobacteria bacterium 54_18_T64]|nr:hypothetical protein A9Q90_04850 [Gammaproteobacteria bacterium 54_18_T64]
MLIGLLFLLLPMLVYIATYAPSRRLRARICSLYRLGAGIVAFAGGGFSLYLAAYSGDQGGITAYYFQLLVIGFYALLSAILIAINYLTRPPE